MYVSETGWTVVIFHWDSFFGPQGYLSYNEFKAKFPNVKTDFLLYGGILTAIKRYNRRLRLEVKENFVIGDASVWKYLYRFSVNDIYNYIHLVKNSNTPKYMEEWSKMLATEIDTKATIESLQEYT